MQAFDHGAFLGGHQPGAKRTGDADGVKQGGAVESQHFTGGDRRRDGPCGALRVKPAQQQIGAGGGADAIGHLITGDNRG